MPQTDNVDGSKFDALTSIGPLLTQLTTRIEIHTSTKRQLLLTDKVQGRKLTIIGPGTKVLPTANASDQLDEPPELIPSIPNPLNLVRRVVVSHVI